MKKCSCCGGNTLRSIPIPFGVAGDANLQIQMHIGEPGHFGYQDYIYDYLDFFVCMDCGHIEWFAEKMVDALKKKDSRISQLKTEIEALKIKLSEAQDELASIDCEINDAEEKSKSLDITIREQQTLLSTIATLKQKRSKIQSEIRTTEQSIRSLQNKLNHN